MELFLGNDPMTVEYVDILDYFGVEVLTFFADGPGLHIRPYGPDLIRVDYFGADAIFGEYYYLAYIREANYGSMGNNKFKQSANLEAGNYTWVIVTDNFNDGGNFTVNYDEFASASGATINTSGQVWKTDTFGSPCNDLHILLV